jgi:two-component system KDP operon response regulator KdpE
MKILIADDDPQILRALKVTLGASGYDIITASDGASALGEAIAHHPDIVMLDLGMPKLDGVQVIEGLRGWSQVPILVVSGRTGAADKVDALDAGARIRALTRRVVAAPDSPAVRFGDVAVDFAAHTVTRTTAVGGTVRLTPTEWRLLELLVQNPGKLITREAMLTQVWGPTHSRDTGYLRLYLAQLRKKLEPVPAQPRYFVTEQGMGYRFVPE